MSASKQLILDGFKCPLSEAIAGFSTNHEERSFQKTLSCVEYLFVLKLKVKKNFAQSIFHIDVIFQILKGSHHPGFPNGYEVVPAQVPNPA